jgi:hypothetical protein
LILLDFPEIQVYSQEIHHFDSGEKMMSRQHLNKRLIRHTAIALSLASAVFSIGSVSAAGRAPVLSKVVANAMKRDLGMNDQQLTQYFTAETTAYVNEGRLAKQLGDRYAGSWLERNADGNFVFVAATTGAVQNPKVGGVELRHHRYSMRELRNAVAELDRIHASAPQKSALRGIYA